MFIDPHVHLRDGKQAYKETIAHGLKVAELAGMTAVFDMPNTDPPVLDEAAALERLTLAEKAGSKVAYGTYIGLTADAEQVKRAVDSYYRSASIIKKVGLEKVIGIVGFKFYAGHSTGNLGVVDHDAQSKVYKTLVEQGYQGILVAHCEKESLIRKKQDGSQDWDPKNPMTHSLARPPGAEVVSVDDQINLALTAGFKGTLHIAHISVPAAVEKIQSYKQKLDITCGVCPHHIIFDQTAMDNPDGLLLKMNPPLRPQGYNTKMLELLRQGKIDWIETDHAPHTLDEKLNPPYASGIPGLQIYPKFVRWLYMQGFSQDKVEDLTFNNIATAFNIPLEARVCKPMLNLEKEYPFNPYKVVL